MKGAFPVFVVLGLGFAATAALADPPAKPPMNDFYQAFYTCASGGAFMMSYDSDDAKSATMTTSNDNRQYKLKRADVQGGFQYKGDGAQFWTDGKTTVVKGTKISYQSCRTKAG